MMPQQLQLCSPRALARRPKGELGLLVLEDGIISPSEDQLLWAMREQLGIDDMYHVQMVMDICGKDAVKECTTCGNMADLYEEYAAWYCKACEAWC